ncbi:MAG: TlpA disulfide reductase family protein [Desulfosarcina sp.]|jgi:peroxiredoxin
MRENSEHGAGIKFQNVFLVGLILAGIVLVFMLQSKDALFNRTSTQLLKKGTPAPDFTLPDLNGNMVNLSDFRGKVILLNIWATWCPPCVQEMPSMEKLHQELKDENFAIVAVSVDSAGSKVVSPFMKTHKLSFLTLTDTKGIVKNLYHTTGVPESLIIDKNGIIVEKIIGPRDWATPDAIKYFRDLSKI